jgi:hypothetical protein
MEPPKLTYDVAGLAIEDQIGEPLTIEQVVL